MYGARGNGLTYGWDTAAGLAERDRENPASPDQRYDTLITLEPGGAKRIWEIAVPNGDYEVHLAVGDPNWYVNERPKVLVEGVVAVDETLSVATRWAEGTVSVTVSDGRLSIRAAPESYAAKLRFAQVIPSE